jgi:DNA-binding phage protein
MNTISIPVTPTLARNYEEATGEKKKKAEQYINAWLNAFLNSKSPDEGLFEVMARATAIAKNNGLTPEKLDELLKDEE